MIAASPSHRPVSMLALLSIERYAVHPAYQSKSTRQRAHSMGFTSRVSAAAEMSTRHRQAFIHG
jgi:hypothetical protein